LAQTLSSSNPGRLSLLEMADGFERRARELESMPSRMTPTKSAWPERRDQAR